MPVERIIELPSLKQGEESPPRGEVQRFEAPGYPQLEAMDPLTVLALWPFLLLGQLAIGLLKMLSTPPSLPVLPFGMPQRETRVLDIARDDSGRIVSILERVVRE
ncbi:MAG: hypothetical protein JRD89_00715 [Deltaproteobacteria bacterium]|nr:hypothetical protein [Deltaproteobacteria bacterium]